MNQIKLLSHQDDFLSLKEKYALLLGGIGSGKTHAGCVYILKNIVEYPRARGAIFANSYRQLSNSTLVSMFRLLNDLQIPYSYNQQKGLLKVANAELLCLSLENYDVHRGIEIGYGWLDEAQDADGEAFNVISGRLRDKKGPLELRLTGTPKGFTWLFDYFVGNKKTDDFKFIKAKTVDNHHLPSGYIQSLYKQYSEKFAQQELEAEFVDTNRGKIYYAFDRNVHVKELKNFRGIPWIGMDFNVDPMTAVIGMLNENQIYIMDEVLLRDSNTRAMCNELIKKGYRGNRIIPDFTGRALKTSSAGVSDLMILEEYGFRIEGSGNPFRMDRYNAVNKLFEENNLIINPNCVNLISDIPLNVYKEGSNVLDTSNKMVGHITDALGYLVWGTIGLGKKHQANRQHQF